MQQLRKMKMEKPKDETEFECLFCGQMVEEPCTALDEWAQCAIGEANTPIEISEAFYAELDTW